MNNVRLVIKGKSYFVDTEAYTIAVSHMISEAQESPDDEKLNRVGFAFLVMCLGIRETLSIPAEDLGDVCREVFNFFTDLVIETA